MTPRTPARDTLTPALDAVRNLCADELNDLDTASGTAAIVTRSEIESRDNAQKNAVFYRCFLPWRARMVAVLAENFRRYFKLALAHPSQTGEDPTVWAWNQLQPAVHVALEWMRDWYILACDGENRRIRRVASLDFVPGQTVSARIPSTAFLSPAETLWRAPAWLFQVSLVLFGIGLMKPQHVPSVNSEGRLGPGHTRLLFKGAKRVFLWSLGEAIERVRNEEIAAAGAIPRRQTEEPDQQKASKRPLKGIEGLGPKKSDLSPYMHNLTEKQQLAFSLKYEYELGLAEIASRMGVDRKTAYEHIEAAERKIEQARSNEKSKAHRAKSEDE